MWRTLFAFLGLAALSAGADEITDYKMTDRVSVYEGTIDETNSDNARGKCKVLVDWQADVIVGKKIDGHIANTGFWIEKSGSDEKPETIWSRGTMYGASPDRGNAILTAYEGQEPQTTREVVVKKGTSRKELRSYFKKTSEQSPEEKANSQAATANSKRPAIVPAGFDLAVIGPKGIWDRMLVCTIDKIIKY